VAIQDVLARFGLIGIFAGALIEGDVTMILAGVIAHLGYVALANAILIGTLGGFAADAIAYAAGRFWSTPIRSSRLYRRAGPTIEHVIGLLGPWQILVARFLWGTNLASMALWGIHRLRFVRFAILALLGCAIWAAVLAVLGFFLSSRAALLVGEVKHVELWLLGALLGAAFVFAMVRTALRRRWRDPRASD
jgi:membrane protein DedA with SNARE-associated domain